MWTNSSNQMSDGDQSSTVKLMAEYMQMFNGRIHTVAMQTFNGRVHRVTVQMFSEQFCQFEY